MSTIFSPDKFAVKSFFYVQYGKIGKSVLRHRKSEPVSDSSHHGDFFFFTLIINNLALTYSLKYDNANKMRQCENIFVL